MWLGPAACPAQVATRHNNNVQIGLFVTIMTSIYMAERLNTLAAANWESFSTQNYFDRQGVFISTLWSTPLLLIGTVMLFQSLYNASSLLIQVRGSSWVAIAAPLLTPSGGTRWCILRPSLVITLMLLSACGGDPRQVKRRQLRQEIRGSKEAKAGQGAKDKNVQGAKEKKVQWSGIRMWDPARSAHFDVTVFVPWLLALLAHAGGVL
jgi:hypothetical protein